MDMNIERIWEAVIAVLLASAGCLARLLHKKNCVKLKLWYVLSELFVSGFAGYMTLYAARLLGLSGDWLGLMSGMAGWMGPRILDVLGDIIVKQIKKIEN